MTKSDDYSELLDIWSKANKECLELTEKLKTASKLKKSIEYRLPYTENQLIDEINCKAKKAEKHYIDSKFKRYLDSDTADPKSDIEDIIICLLAHSNPNSKYILNQEIAFNLAFELEQLKEGNVKEGLKSDLLSNMFTTKRPYSPMLSSYEQDAVKYLMSQKNEVPVGNFRNLKIDLSKKFSVTEKTINIWLKKHSAECEDKLSQNQHVDERTSLKTIAYASAARYKEKTRLRNF
ncbi:MAG: hypothetical protein V7784_15485 [Oceanospirillaceae bacterium]